MLNTDEPTKHTDQQVSGESVSEIAGVKIASFGRWRRSAFAPLVLEEGVRLRVKISGVVLRSCQRPKVSNDDTEVFAV